MTPLEKLDAIERMCHLHDIQFRPEGVGLLLYVPGRVIPEAVIEKERGDFPSQIDSPNWRKNLILHRYYPSLEEAIDSEYDRLSATPDAGWQLIHSTGEQDG